MLPPRNEEPRILICPSLLSADFCQLKTSVAKLEDEADYLHLDIMDGHFVPNISYGPGIVTQLRSIWHKPFDVHLMVSRPEDWLEPFAKAGADLIVFHQEASPHGQRLLQRIHELGVSAGIALCPGSPEELVRPLLPWLDLVLVMTVNPGFGGQKYIGEMESKIASLRSMLEAHHCPARLQVDGGISASTIAAAAAAGADTFVAGSAVFKAEDPVAAIRDMRRLAEQSSCGQASF